MAKEEAPKPKWYKAFGQAFTFVRKNDKPFLPGFIAIVGVILAAGVVIGFVVGSPIAHVYSNLLGLSLALLAGMGWLVRRIDPAVLSQVEGVPGGSLRALQLIRRGWSFEETPIAYDGRGTVVFQGVGKGGVVLVAEGGNAAHKVVATTHKRYQKLVPGVPITEIYVGNGQGQVPLRGLAKHVKGLKKELSKRERGAVAARLHAVGGAKVPIPKGVDPMRARPNRKAMRG